jgi:hypothetical protein
MREYFHQYIDRIFNFIGMDTKLGVVLIACLFVYLLIRKQKWKELSSINRFYIILIIVNLMLLILGLIIL